LFTLGFLQLEKRGFSRSFKRATEPQHLPENMVMLALNLIIINYKKVIVTLEIDFNRISFHSIRIKLREGTLSGFIAASSAGFYFAGGIALIGSVFGMLAGAVNKHDNMAVPYAVAGWRWEWCYMQQSGLN
jgi:hypothetical protein